jgi:F0F1-type ATP synthase membrane subunit b/b'
MNNVHLLLKRVYFFLSSFYIINLFLIFLEDSVEKKSSNVSPQIRDNETLLLQIEALQAQLEEQTKLAKEQVESLLEDRRVRIEEYDIQRKRDEERLKQSQEKYLPFCLIYSNIFDLFFSLKELFKCKIFFMNQRKM